MTGREDREAKAARQRVERAITSEPAQSRSRTPPGRPVIPRAEPKRARIDGHTVSSGESRKFPTIRDMVGRLGEVDAEALASFDPKELEAVASHLPSDYRCVGHDVPLVAALRSYECDGKVHPVPVYAPQGTAVHADGTLVDTSLTLEQLLNGDGGDLRANVLYFFQSYCFHPDSGPKDNSGPTMNQLTAGSPTRRVVTLDTGRVDATYSPPLAFQDGAADAWPDDAVRGHGPAIADLIGDMIGDGHYSSLVAINPPTGQGQGHAYQIKDGTSWKRAFDTTLLLNALKFVAAEYGHCDILNLSLGTAAVPQDMQVDHVATWIEKEWLRGNPNKAVVAAAGNHGTCVPTFPAAHCYDWSARGGPQFNARHRDQIYSVGSPRPLPNDFSAYSDPDADWVRYLRPGRDIQVAHHNSKLTSWTGTSFATPQVAAQLAVGITP